MSGPWTFISYPWVTFLVHVHTSNHYLDMGHVHIHCSLPLSQGPNLHPTAQWQVPPSCPSAPLAQHVQSGPTYPIPGASPGRLQFILPVSPSPCDSRSNPESHQLCFMLLSHPLDLVTCWDHSHLPSTFGFPLWSPRMAWCTGWVFRVKHGFKSQLCCLLYVWVWTLLNIIKPPLYNGRLMMS